MSTAINFKTTSYENDSLTPALPSLWTLCWKQLQHWAGKIPSMTLSPAIFRNTTKTAVTLCHLLSSLSVRNLQKQAIIPTPLGDHHPFVAWISIESCSCSFALADVLQAEKMTPECLSSIWLFPAKHWSKCFNLLGWIWKPFFFLKIRDLRNPRRISNKNHFPCLAFLHKLVQRKLKFSEFMFSEHIVWTQRYCTEPVF